METPLMGMAALLCVCRPGRCGAAPDRSRPLIAIVAIVVNECGRRRIDDGRRCLFGVSGRRWSYGSGLTSRPQRHHALAQLRIQTEDRRLQASEQLRRQEPREPKQRQAQHAAARLRQLKPGRPCGRCARMRCLQSPAFCLLLRYRSFQQGLTA